VTDVEYLAQMWSAVSGISAQMGFEFAKLGSFAKLSSKDDTTLRVCLESVRYSGGRALNKNTVNTAYGLVRGTSPRGIDAKLFAKVPRLSDSVGKLLSRHHSVADIVQMTAEAVDSLKLPGAKKKLGKCGVRLHELLHFSFGGDADSDESDTDSDESDTDSDESDTDSTDSDESDTDSTDSDTSDTDSD
jgi:hypothetical protein